jgi:hypothetical protein
MSPHDQQPPNHEPEVPMSLHAHISQRIVNLNDTLLDQEVTPQLRATGRAGLDEILLESLLGLAREVDALKAQARDA